VPADLPYRRRRRSTLRLLFSTDYSEFVTTRLVKAGYRIAILATIIAVTMWAWTALSLPSWVGWGIPAAILFFAPLTGLAFLGALRVATEYLQVMFGIAEKVHALDHKVGYLANVTYNDHNPPNPHPHERKDDAA
jgi:hypothetical protein